MQQTMLNLTLTGTADCLLHSNVILKSANIFANNLANEINKLKVKVLQRQTYLKFLSLVRCIEKFVHYKVK